MSFVTSAAGRHRPLPLALLVGVLLLIIAAPASAHVTLRVDNAAPGAFAVYTLRVPNESETAGTTQIEVQVPDDVEFGRYEPVPGWDIAIVDGVVTVSGGLIEPGQFQDFRFSARNPEEPVLLRFPAIQTYEDGEVVEWIGPEDADKPASVVEIAGEAAGGHGSSHGGADDEAADTEAADAGDEAVGDEAADADAADDEVDADPISADDAADSSGNGLSVAGLIAGLLGVVMGGAALMRSGRTR